jgi:cysteine desulfurase
MAVEMTSGQVTYLDCAASAPVDPRVAEAALHYMTVEYGNAGSRTHDFGRRAHRAVEQARDQVAAVVGCKRGEVIFTSGATEANNLAILGLAEHGEKSGRKHIISTQVEHNAVLMPLVALSRRGFELTMVKPASGGWEEPQAVAAAMRPDTLLVSVMQVNNETGIRQPIEEIARMLGGHAAYFHVDAAQGFGKELAPLRNERIDLIGISGHKVCAPKGIGALIARRRDGQRPPLTPLTHGGGQELGLRPGTLPVHLVVALGLAAELAAAEHGARMERCRWFKQKLLAQLRPLNPVVNGDAERAVDYIVNLAFPGITTDIAIDALRDVVAISDGSACTSGNIACSHVLAAMGLADEQLEGALRFSWCHLTPEPNWGRMVEAIRRIRPAGGL